MEESKSKKVREREIEENKRNGKEQENYGREQGRDGIE